MIMVTGDGLEEYSARVNRAAHNPSSFAGRIAFGRLLDTSINTAFWRAPKSSTLTAGLTFN